jgi:predicted transposase YbfD/YdcC
LVTEEKNDEIQVVPKLLDSLDVKGDSVTTDAISCQTGIVKKLREKEVDYIRAVKEKSEEALWE